MMATRDPGWEPWGMQAEHTIPVALRSWAVPPRPATPPQAPPQAPAALVVQNRRRHARPGRTRWWPW